MFETFGTVNKKQGRVTASCWRQLVQLVRNKAEIQPHVRAFGTGNRKQGRVTASYLSNFVQ